MALSLLDLLDATVRDIRGNWVRSGLTALGIFMGVAAVNITLNIDAITTAQLAEKLAQRDRPFAFPIVYDPERRRPNPDFAEADLQDMQRQVNGIQGYSLSSYLYFVNTVRFRGNQATNVEVIGVSSTYQAVTGRQLVQGRFFNSTDFEQYYPVAIIDTVLAEQLFQNEPPLGQGVYAGGTRLTVIGVSESKMDWAGDVPSGEMWVPRPFAIAMAGGHSFDRGQLALTDLEQFESVQTDLEALLRQQYPGYFVRVGSNASDLYEEEQQQRASARVFKSMGILALVIGGVGIANITVAAVVERTREIGLRRALGATDFEVMAQFIAEAVVLSLVGGLVAVTTVHFVTKAAAAQVFEVTYEFRMQDALISMGAAFVVGVGSSFLPALRVTRLDVVEALRGE